MPTLLGVLSVVATILVMTLSMDQYANARCSLEDIKNNVHCGAYADYPALPHGDSGTSIIHGQEVVYMTAVLGIIFGSLAATFFVRTRSNNVLSESKLQG